MSLRQEINDAAQKVRTDSYEMSVGELVNMYRDEELQINPGFQRLFRWDIHQKSKFIESLLLSIPIPPIFVFETNKGSWELIDGLQRVSTILEFMGLLLNDEGDEVKPSKLMGTKYAPSLEDVTWDDLDSSQQFTIKRARIGVQILRKTSTERSKYDLFQRLNSGGTAANAQELRNCQVIMMNEGFFELLEELSNSESFRALIQATDNADLKQGPIEYTMRFWAHLRVPYTQGLDVEEYIDDAMLTLAAKYKEDYAARYTALFTWVFDSPREALGENALRRYKDGKFVGKVGRVGFELIAVGLAQQYERLRRKDSIRTSLIRHIRNLWSQPAVATFLRPGLRGTARIKGTIPFGKEWFDRLR